MAKVKIQGNASGTGVITLTAPNTSTDRTVVLPDADVTLGADATKLPLAGGTMTGNLVVSADVDITGSLNGTSGALDIKNEANNENIFIKTTSSGSEITALKIHSGGTLELPSGGLRVGGTGASNTLEDYEEGTCTIQYSDGTTSVGSANTSKYTKVGRQVTVTGYINVVNIDALTDSSSIRLAGFPFTATTDTTFSFFSRFVNAPTNTINMVGYLANNYTFAQMYAMVDNAAYQNIICGNVGNSNDLYFGVTYTAT